MNPNRVGWFSGGEDPCEPIPPLQPHPRRLILLGPPGVGKGTQATRLCQQLRACHLSTGDLFRAAKCEGASSPAMQQALRAMQRGELVSDQLVVAMVRERAMCLSCRGGFLLDGFPRTVQQAEELEAILDDLQVKLDAAVLFELPIEEIVSRLSGRRTCDSCRAVFHVTTNPPRNPGVCDRCRGQLIQRDDDRPEAIRVRMAAYETETQPLVDYYHEHDKLMRIPAWGTPEDVFHRTMKRLAGMGIAEPCVSSQEA